MHKKIENKNSNNQQQSTSANNKNGSYSNGGYASKNQAPGTMLKPGQYACNFQGQNKTYTRFYGNEALTKEAIDWIVANNAYIEVEGKNGFYIKADEKAIPNDLGLKQEKTQEAPKAPTKSVLHSLF